MNKDTIHTNTLRGSITLFLSLMLLLVSSLLFSLLELSRYHALSMMRDLTSQTMIESLFAEYNLPAYESYHLLMLDAGRGSGELLLSDLNAKMQRVGQENLAPTVTGLGNFCNFLQMNVTESRVTKYELLTDQKGAVLLDQIVDVMKKETVVGMLESTKNLFSSTQNTMQTGNQADECIEKGLDSIQEELQRQKEQGMEEGLESQAQGKKEDQKENQIENPIEDVQKTRSSPLLVQILPEESRISAKQIEEKETAGYRTLNSGNYEKVHAISIADQLLISQYFQKYTSNYRNQLPMTHALAYEQEYLLFGHCSDEKNLEKMAGKLVLVREGINFAYLMTDSIKQAEAMTLALEIAAAMGVPAVAKAIQMGLLASWAYAESIVELRTLFAGGKIALTKTGANWNVGIAEMTLAILDRTRKAKEISGGQSYEDYIKAFLCLESNKKIGMRFASLLEQNLRLYQGYEQIKVDCMVTAAEINCSYEAKQVFLSFVLMENALGGYGFQNQASFQYSKN